MDIVISRDDIVKAKEVYLFNQDTLYIIDDNETPYGLIKGQKEWFIKESFWDYFDSRLMMTYLQVPSKEEALKIYDEWISL